MQYYSDQVNGIRPRNKDDIPHNVWCGIVVTIDTLIEKGAFGEDFPDTCPDGYGIVGTDVGAFSATLQAEIPTIEYPLKTKEIDESSWNKHSSPFVPDYITILDLVQFCYKHVAKPIEESYHSYFRHHHLSFNKDQGQKDFIDKINTLFQRNQISYELQTNGNIVRLAPEILADSLANTKFETSDNILNQMLTQACLKFLNPSIAIRRESLERLWDSWERLKTILNPDNKKQSISQLLERCSPEQAFRDLLNSEAKSLTNIGNSFQIRHSEVGQVIVNQSDHIDYLFHRLFCFIQLAIKYLA